MELYIQHLLPATASAAGAGQAPGPAAAGARRCLQGAARRRPQDNAKPDSPTPSGRGELANSKSASVQRLHASACACLAFCTAALPCLPCPAPLRSSTHGTCMLRTCTPTRARFLLRPGLPSPSPWMQYIHLPRPPGNTSWPWPWPSPRALILVPLPHPKSTPSHNMVPGPPPPPPFSFFPPSPPFDPSRLFRQGSVPPFRAR